jgi:hypothetical protein
VEQQLGVRGVRHAVAVPERRLSRLDRRHGRSLRPVADVGEHAGRRGFDVVPGTYGAFGNDGQHFNNDINADGFNNAVGYTVATALRQASDHLPVLMVIRSRPRWRRPRRSTSATSSSRARRPRT